MTDDLQKSEGRKGGNASNASSLRILGIGLFTITGAITLAFIGALAGLWDIPAARIGFGKGAIVLAVAAVAASTSLTGSYAAEQSTAIKKFWSIVCYAGLILSMVFAVFGLVWTTGYISPCFQPKPPVACQPQDWGATTP